MKDKKSRSDEVTTPVADEDASAEAPADSTRNGSVDKVPVGWGSSGGTREPAAGGAVGRGPSGIATANRQSGDQARVGTRSGQSSPPPVQTWSYPAPVPPTRGTAPRTLPAGSFPPSARPAATMGPALPSFGPSGKRRSVVAVVALSIVTLGVYALIWHRRINAEIGDFDARMHVHPGRSMIAVMVPWIIGWLVSLAGAARIVLAVLNVTLPFDPQFSVYQAYFLLGGVLVIPYLELILPFSVTAIVMTLERVRIVEDRVGRTTDVQLRPTRAVWWLLVPVVGGLILVAGTQRRLNRVWELASTPLLTGRVSRI